MDFRGKRSLRMGVTLLFQLFGAIGPIAAEIEMQFTKYPESVIAPVGDKVTFECAVRVPGERLTWRWKAVGQSDDWDDWKDIPNTSASDSISTKLVVEVKEDTPTALYQCVVWYGGISLVSVPAKLSIARIDLSRNTAEKRVIVVPINNTIVLHCKEPLSEPPAILSWWKDTGKGGRKQLETPHGVLVIHNAKIEDSGTYGCVATNELSGQTVDLPEKTYLKVQHEGNGGYRFLESEDYVGIIDEEGVLTKPVVPGSPLRLWCGAVGTPPPKFVWTKEGGSSLLQKHDHLVTVSPFLPEEEGIYSCSANGLRRSWKVVALTPPHWEGAAASESANEGASAHISCGLPRGQPPPKVHWMLNAELVKPGDGIRANESDLYIAVAAKRHAGVVQCFACNARGCAADAAVLTVVPAQISDQEYSAEAPKTLHISAQQPKRHSRKNPRKHKAVLVPPSRPNVTRMSDESVMVSWSHDNHGLPIQFFKVQYKEAGNSTNAPWQTANYDIPSHIHSHLIDGLTPNKFYKFRIAAVYSNHDNKLGKSSSKFFLQRGGFQSPRTPVLTEATALTPHSIRLNWTWSSDGGVEAEGFYVYYRAVSSAGAYEKVTVRGTARSLVLSYLAPDTAYEVKLQAYTAQAPSDFSSILVSKTHRASGSVPSGGPVGSSTSAPEDVKGSTRGGGAVLAAGGAAAAAALLLALAVTLPLCRRARRPAADSEYYSEDVKGSTRGGGAVLAAGGAAAAAALLLALAVTLPLCRRARRPAADSEYYSEDVKGSTRGGGAVLAAGGAAAAAALLLALAVTLPLCRRARRPAADSEYYSEDVKGSTRGGGAVLAAGGAAAAAALLLALAVTLPLCRRARRPAADSEYYSEDVKGSTRGGGAVLAAGGAAAAAALLLALAVTLPLCRRARRPAADKEKAPGESGAGNVYIPAKVPITITGNPMHAEGGDAGVEMSFLHNNNCGGAASNDDTLPHSRKNGPPRQYV